MVQRPYQNVKSIRQAVFKLPRSQAISCIGYNVNLQTAVAAILIFVECPKPIVSEVLVVLRPYQVNQISGFQDITFTSNCGRTDRQPDTDRQTDGRTGPFHNMSRLSKVKWPMVSDK